MAKLRTLPPLVRTLDTRLVKPEPKKADPFYLSPEWRKLMDELYAERGRRCEDCGRTGCRIFGDHIAELKDGGAPLDKGNIKLRCGSCHTKKTAATRAARLAQRF
jgi:hypothetical protein